MKTIAVCAALSALAFWLLPGNGAWEAAEKTEPMVLLVETAEETAAPKGILPEAPEENDEDTQTVRLLTEGGVKALSMQEYLTEVLLSEMPPDFSPEARRAQVVAARTFTCKKMEHPKHENADVCADPACCQAWTSREALKETYGADFEAVWESAKEAVLSTAGEVLTYDGALIDAVYFSCSGGETEAAVAVWGSDVPYLQSVESPGEEDAPRFSSQAVFSPEEFRAALRKEDEKLLLEGAPQTWLGSCMRTAGGGVERLEIGGRAFSGTELRRIFGLNSARFTLTYADGSFVFDVRGFGHRVGLSQYGAETMAQLGFSHRTILEYYYQGARVEKM